MPVGKGKKSRRSGRSQHNRTTSSRRRSSSRSTGKSSSRQEPSSKRSGRHSRAGRSRRSQHSSRRKHIKSESEPALPTLGTGGLSPPKQREYIPIRSKQTSSKETRSSRSSRRSNRFNRELEQTLSTKSRRSVRADGHKRPPETSKEDEDSSDLDYSDFDDTQWENTVWKKQHLRVKRGLYPESSSSKSVTNPKKNQDVEAGDVGTDVLGEARQTIIERGAHHLQRPITTLALLTFEGMIALSAVAVVLIEGYAVYGQIATLINMLTVTILVGLLTWFIFRSSHIEMTEDEQDKTCRMKLVWKSLLLVTHLLRLGLTLTSVAIELYYAACGDASFVTRRCDIDRRFFYPAASLLTLTAVLQGFHLFYVFFRRRFVIRRPC